MTAEITVDGLPIPPASAERDPEQQPRSRPRRRAMVLLLLLGLLATLVTIALWYFLFRQPITALPLPGIPTAEVPGYSTAMYGTERPMGVAVSPSGDRIYVSQSEGARVGLVLDGSGNTLATMAPPASTGTDHVPLFIAIDPLTSEVYVTDRPAGAVYIYDRDGAYERTLALAKPIVAWQPVGIAFDATGLLYIGDLSGASPTIEVFDRQANLVRRIGADNRMSFPNGVAVDAGGNVYVADSNNGRLLVFDAAGALRAQVGRGAGQGNLGLPRGVAVDDHGRVFVADNTGQGLFVFGTPQPGSRILDLIGYVGGEGAADAKFSYPNGVATDGRGRVYIADTANNRLQLWSY